jgi:hypothetical protein
MTIDKIDAKTVYVRPVKRENLPQDVRAKLPVRDTVYSVQREDGEQLALVRDRKLAFILARQNDFVPLDVH